ncbi:hypothetical protein Pint_02468 [Pistacia integerrima]|uniref:Uncharacterized protein n=1 Tax=Pistacia integerrima TaxID=434235 RepID=A0ACC0ZLU8_9ROSI|nr:hypothetical protein Pint_02468 [Pistacia integerrima]
MAICLSYCPDPVPHKTSISFSSRLRFNSQEALFLLRKCTTFNQLKLIHARIIRHGLTDDQLLVRKLLDICYSYGKMDYALLVFHQIQRPHAFTWNLMIRALTNSGRSRKAMDLFNLMMCKGCAPDKFTFPFVIKACLAAFDVEKGKEVHGLAVKTGFSRDMFVQNTLMDLYFKCEDVDSGSKVFEKMRVRSVVSWTTMITGLAACGDLDSARAVFEQMESRNVVSWTAMINAYVRNQQPQEAFELFWRMQLDNVRPNELNTMPENLNENTEAALQRLNALPEKLNENTEAVLRRLNAMLKLNESTAAAWVTPSVDKRVTDMEKNSLQFTNESNCLGVFTCYVPQYQLQCFKWDVG